MRGQGKVDAAGLPTIEHLVGRIQRRFGFAQPHGRLQHIDARGTGHFQQLLLRGARGKAKDIGKTQSSPVAGGDPSGFCQRGVDQALPGLGRVFKVAARAYPVGHAGQACNKAGLRCTGNLRPVHAQALLQRLHQRGALCLPGTAAKHFGIGLLASQLGRKPVVLPDDFWNPRRCTQCLGRCLADACMAAPLPLKLRRNGLLGNVFYTTGAAASQLFHKAGADLANIVAGSCKCGMARKQVRL